MVSGDMGLLPLGERWDREPDLSSCLEDSWKLVEFRKEVVGRELYVVRGAVYDGSDVRKHVNNSSFVSVALTRLELIVFPRTPVPKRSEFLIKVDNDFLRFVESGHLPFGKDTLS